MTDNAPQQQALTFEKGNLLVNAGAGSGKTTTLKRRVARLVKKGYQIRRMLIVTFTNAASSDMRDKIKKELIENDLLEAANEVDFAHIETFDSFFFYLVKRYALEIELDNNISIADGTIFTVKLKKIIDEVFEEEYNAHNQDFEDLIVTYTTKDDSLLKTLVEQIIRLSSLQRNPDEFLDLLITKYFEEDYLKSLTDSLLLKYKKTCEILYTAQAELETDTLINEADQFYNDIQAINNLDELRHYIENISFSKCPNGSNDKKIKEEITSALKSISQSNLDYTNSAIQTHLSLKPYVETLVRLAKKANKIFADYKRLHNCYEFNDLTHMALDILQKPHVQNEVKNCFDFIMVDEYQDTSDLQEEILQLISNNNLFMVGDVKQSIYRFRNANCNIFLNKYYDYKNCKGGLTVDMNTSYRSRQEIVDTVNNTFKALMNKNENSITYDESQEMKFGAKKYNLNNSNDDYSTNCIEYTYDQSSDSVFMEARIIAKDIINKINSGYKVLDEGNLRPCKFSDFAILIDRSTNFKTYLTILNSYNISTNVIGDEKIRSDDLTYVTKNLLILYNSINKSQFDNDFKHAFYSISRSFVSETADYEIYLTSKNNAFTISELYCDISEVVANTQGYPLSVILSNLYDKLGIFDSVNKLARYINNNNKCDMFVALMSSMDSLGFDIEDAIQFFNDLYLYDMELPYNSLETVDNSVTICTMHKSKGLEYPIVYLAGLNKQFSKNDSKSSFIVSEKCGVILPNVGVNTKDSLFNAVYKTEEAYEDYCEKLRLLYVAFTRAKEKLIVLIGNKESGSSSETSTSSKSSSFAKILRKIDFNDTYFYSFVYKDETLNYPSNCFEDKEFAFKSINAYGHVKSIKRASKQLNPDEPNTELLAFGEQMHYLLEITDFKTKDISFIKNKRYQKYISNILNADVMKNVDKAEIRKEFEFYDEINDVKGIIDCLLIFDDHIDIVDFKLKNIDDENYDKQLQVYKNYIKTISKLPIRMCLISCVTGDIRYVE